MSWIYLPLNIIMHAQLLLFYCKSNGLILRAVVVCRILLWCHPGSRNVFLTFNYHPNINVQLKPSSRTSKCNYTFITIISEAFSAWVFFFVCFLGGVSTHSVPALRLPVCFLAMSLLPFQISLLLCVWMLICFDTLLSLNRLFRPD